MERVMREWIAWDRVGPAPYESAWSLFIKVMSLNLWKPDDLYEIFGKRASGVPRPTGAAFYESVSWVDLERMSATFRVDSKRLGTAFLDSLGFPRSSLNYPTGIRHCPVCVAQGYHSTLFQLGFIARCPWHDEELLQPCYPCARAVARTGVRWHRGAVRRGSPEWEEAFPIFDLGCGHWRRKFVELLPTDRLSAVQRAAVARHGDALVSWAHRLDLTKAYHAATFVSLLDYVPCEPGLESTGIPQDLNLCLDRQLRMGWANALAGPCPWTVRVRAVPGRLLHLSRVSHTDALNERGLAWRADLLARRFAGIRRYLYRRYVHAHARCVRRLLRLTRDGALAVSRDAVCPVALAFVSWVLSTRGFANIEAWHLCQPWCTPKALHSFRCFAGREREFGLALLARFFHARLHIAAALASQRPFRVVRNDDLDRRPGVTTWWDDPHFCIQVPSHQNGQAQVNSYLLVPDPDAPNPQGKGCSVSHAQAGPLVDSGATERGVNLAWVKQFDQDRTSVLFAVHAAQFRGEYFRDISI